MTCYQLCIEHATTNHVFFCYIQSVWPNTFCGQPPAWTTDNYLLGQRLLHKFSDWHRTITVSAVCLVSLSILRVILACKVDHSQHIGHRGCLMVFLERHVRWTLGQLSLIIIIKERFVSFFFKSPGFKPIQFFFFFWPPVNGSVIGRVGLSGEKF